MSSKGAKATAKAAAQQAKAAEQAALAAEKASKAAGKAQEKAAKPAKPSQQAGGKGREQAQKAHAQAKRVLPGSASEQQQRLAVEVEELQKKHEQAQWDRVRHEFNGDMTRVRQWFKDAAAKAEEEAAQEQQRIADEEKKEADRLAELMPQGLAFIERWDKHDVNNVSIEWMKAMSKEGTDKFGGTHGAQAKGAVAADMLWRKKLAKCIKSINDSIRRRENDENRKAFEKDLAKQVVQLSSGELCETRAVQGHVSRFWDKGTFCYNGPRTQKELAKAKKAKAEEEGDLVGLEEPEKGRTSYQWYSAPAADTNGIADSNNWEERGIKFEPSRFHRTGAQFVSELVTVVTCADESLKKEMDAHNTTKRRLDELLEAFGTSDAEEVFKRVRAEREEEKDAEQAEFAADMEE